MKFYDYVIVGGGTAGCVLANRLSENPDTSVLLLEAGSRDINPYIHIPGGVGKLFGPGVNWRFQTVPQPEMDDREIWYPQGKTLGGSSAINAMIYIRAQAEDYDAWAKMGNEGWDYQDVLPYFKKSEDNSRIIDEFHGQGGPQQVSDQVNPHILSTSFINAMQSFGLPYNPDFNGTTMYGTGLYQAVWRAGLRKSQAVAFLAPVIHRKNLAVKTHTQVISILVEGERAVGVMARRFGQTQKIYANAEVILSAGAINTPKVMLLSGIGSPDHLSKIGIKPVHELAGVGRNLQDHLNVNVHSKLKEPISYDGLDRFPRMIKPGLEWIFFRRGPAASMIVEGGGFLKSPHSYRPDMQVHIAPALVVRGGQTQLDEHGFTVNSTYLQPESVGSVSLKSSNPSDSPLIDPQYLSARKDREMAVYLVRTIRQILAQPEMAKFIDREILPGSDNQTDEQILAYARQYGSCDYHPVGTCRMGKDEDAVVDPLLRVIGIQALRIIDSSIMPRLVSGNTMAPTMMIAEKGADLVKQGI